MYKLKLLTELHIVPRWHIKQYTKEKVESKKMTTNENVNL